MKKTLYLMRHGQTLFNLRKKIQGACDSPLTDEGKRQAKIAGLYFKENNIIFDHAYSSTQERASDTLEIVTDYKMPYERLKGIKEWNFGVFEGESEDLNPPHKPNERSFGDFFVKFKGESEKQVSERMTKALIDIMERESHKKVLAVSHGAACYAFMLKYAPDFPFSGIPNCSIFKYEYENGNFNLIELIKHDFSKEI